MFVGALRRADCYGLLWWTPINEAISTASRAVVCAVRVLKNDKDNGVLQ